MLIKGLFRATKLHNNEKEGLLLAPKIYSPTTTNHQKVRSTHPSQNISLRQSLSLCYIPQNPNSTQSPATKKPFPQKGSVKNSKLPHTQTTNLLGGIIVFQIGRQNFYTWSGADQRKINLLNFIIIVPQQYRYYIWTWN